MSLSLDEIKKGFLTLLNGDEEATMLLRPEKLTIRNMKGYTRVTFPDMEFLLVKKKFFLEDKRIFAVRGTIFRVVVPREEEQATLYISGWKQTKITPIDIMKFLSQIPGFPQINSISIPKDKRTGRFNAFYCFISVQARRVDDILRMEITSNGKKLKMERARKMEGNE